MAHLVPAVLRVTGIVVALCALPTLARSDEAAAPQLACELTSDLAISTDEIRTVAPEIPQPIEPTVDDIRVATGQHWRLDTPRGVVHVWLPPNYDPATAATVVFVHGYKTDLETMWTGAQLPQQFAHSQVNAMFIVPEAPSAKLVPMVWPSLDALLKTVTAGTKQPLPKGRVVAMGHSGAYRTIVLWLANQRLGTIVLLDGAYGELDRFAEWVRASRAHRFINIAYETQPFSDFMHQSMPGTLQVVGLPDAIDFDDTARAARVLYVRTDVGHWPLVTAGVAIPAALRALGAPILAN
jgi:hypothetical protein